MHALRALISALLTPLFRSAVMLALVPRCAAWVLQSPYPPGIAGIGYGVTENTLWHNNNSFDLSSIVLRWGLAELSKSDALGGGITWALHPDFCGQLLPRFPEKEGQFIDFVSCEDLRAATSTAFSTWSMNNPQISFDDVTEACLTRGIGNGTNWTCADAELVIQPSSSESSTSEAVAWVEYNLKDVDWQPLTTAGKRLKLGIGIREASMQVSVNYCWYLDATFCYHFFRLQDAWGTEKAALAIRLVCVVTLTMAGVYMGLIFYRALRVSAPEARKLTVLAKRKTKKKLGGKAFPFGGKPVVVGDDDDDDDDDDESPQGAKKPPTRASPPPSPPEGDAAKGEPAKKENKLMGAWAGLAKGNGGGGAEGKPAEGKPAEGKPAGGEGGKGKLGWGADVIEESSSGSESEGEPPPPGEEEDMWEGVGQCEALVEYLASMPAGPFLMSSFWLIFLPTFYFRIFLPCWDCHDYEATMAHEIGHVLGFTHPNEKPDMNLRATTAMSAAVCGDPFNYVEFAGELSKELSTTIMYSITQHLDKTCLTSDDVEGLNFLYPYCDHPAQGPKCIKPRKYSGLLRLAVAVFVPFLGIALFMLLILYIVRRSTRIQLIRAKRKMTQKLAELTSIQTKLDEAELALINSNAEKQRMREQHENEKKALQGGGRTSQAGGMKKMRLAMALAGKGEAGKKKSLFSVLNDAKKEEAKPDPADKMKNILALARQQRNGDAPHAHHHHHHHPPQGAHNLAALLHTPPKRSQSILKMDGDGSRASAAPRSLSRRMSHEALDPAGTLTRSSTRRHVVRSLLDDDGGARHSQPHLPALPEGWTEHETTDGRMYYYCKAANKSSWVRPVAVAGNKKGRNTIHALPETWKELGTDDGEHYYCKKESTRARRKNTSEGDAESHKSRRRSSKCSLGEGEADSHKSRRNSRSHRGDEDEPLDRQKSRPSEARREDEKDEAVSQEQNKSEPKEDKAEAQDEGKKEAQSDQHEKAETASPGKLDC